MTRKWFILAAVVITCGLLGGRPAAGQSRPAAARDGARDLAADVTRRFDVLQLRDGVVLRPKKPIAGVGAIELSGDIAIDGTPMMGAELRGKLGADADLVLRLSYLDPAARRALFAGGAPAAPAPSAPEAPVTPATPTPPSTQDDTVRESDRLERLRDRAEARAERRGSRNGDRVRIGGGVTVNEGEVVSGDVVAIGGHVRVDGEVQGDVVSVGGGVTLGPHAVVEKNVVVVGGKLTRDAGARVGGEVQEVDVFDFGALHWPGAAHGVLSGRGVGAGFSLIATLTRVGVLCLLAAVVVLIGRRWVEQVGPRAFAEPLKAGAIGLLSQVLFLPLLIVTILVCVVTIVGIPLLLLVPFVILALLCVGLVGFTAVAHEVGTRVNARFGWTRGPYVTTVAGILVVLTPIVLARILRLGGFMISPLATLLVVVGTILEYLAWTVWFGAVALTRFRRTPPMSHDSPAMR